MGVIVDWFGSADYYDYATINRNTTQLFEYTRRAGLKFAICYEDQTIQRFIDGKRLVPGEASGMPQEEMLYLQSISSRTKLSADQWPAVAGKFRSAIFSGRRELGPDFFGAAAVQSSGFFFPKTTSLTLEWVLLTGRPCGSAATGDRRRIVGSVAQELPQ